MVQSARTTRTSDRPLIEFHGVDVRLGRQDVLREIELDIPRGQAMAVIGESGCGKTVLLKTIIGLIRPTRGNVLFDGRELVGLDDRTLAKERIRFGFLFQNAALFDSMTVGQNVAFPLRQHTNRPAGQVRETVLASLAEVGLPDSVVGKKPAELSGGMRKRVGLARALAMDPEVLLYDEPTTGLDPIMSDVINELILHTNQRGNVTSVIVTHDMRTACKVADRVVMICPLARLGPKEPQVIFDGSPEDLDRTGDRRVTQFTRGEAGERLMEMRQAKQS